jgi:hypothetical protein
MVPRAMIRRVCWYLALVILTGVAVVWVRCKRPVALAPRTDTGLAGRIERKERNFDFAEQPEVPPPTVVNLESDSTCKDTLVRIQEANTGSLLFGIGIDSNAGLTGSITTNERNFDLGPLPMPFEDILNDTPFRDAGPNERIEVVPGNPPREPGLR